MMGFWSKKDSDNLDSIARSLEALAEREKERALILKENPTIPFTYGLLDRIKQHISKEKIKVIDSTSLEDEALEEALMNAQRMNSKVDEAKRTGNVPYVIEDLFDEEELESLR